MSIVSALNAGRRAAEARMTSRATIRRKTGKTAQNPETGRVEPIWDVVEADCPGRIAGNPRGGSGSRTVDVGGVEVTVATREWHMPVSRSALQDDDMVEVTAGENAGLVLRVVEGTFQDQATARRVPVVEAQRPTEWG